MLPDDLRSLTIIPVHAILTAEEQVPQESGVYLFFFRGGNRLLAATPYFDMEYRRPLCLGRRQHLYTGAAYDCVVG